ncbi:MAG TPA: hypothetical protein VHE80_08605 [Acidimicrobiales bacterium]|nr:hypothetical protein [Acidimicrobiales bacterium]
MSSTEQLIAEWREKAAEETFLSASRVQDRLFDLYGEVQELPAGRVVEAWLTLTITRELFSGEELLGMLDEIEAGLGQPVGAQ